MASRLRPPAGSKLVRPVPTGTSLRPLSGTKPSATAAGGGSSRPNSQSTGNYEREGPPMTRTTPVGGLRKSGGGGGAARPSSQTRAGSQEKPVQQASNGTATPGFEVGDHVLVGGVKPGVIAFLGPTQFAKGTWAGVVLDTADGKNNGSVNGVQYFTCEQNRGLFAKPEKLEFVSRGSANKPPPSSSSSRPQATGLGGDGSNYTFQVGDRIMVDGVKPGVVGFYGETEFARGIWAGIILDAKEGKNDGTVAGVEYFKCENNHGLFTRPQKLKLVESTSTMNSHSAPIPSVQQINQRAPSQERSRPPVMADPAQIKALREKLKLGDHVLVAGVKEGILRFIGTTEFARGIWAGVELAEPMGKNDGAVSGKRYFHCPPKHGLFAPLPKVEKLASAASSSEKSTPPGPSAVSSTASLTPPSTVHSSPPGTIKIPRGMERGVALPIVPPAGRRLSESSMSSTGMVQDYMLPSLQGTTSGGLSHLLQEKEHKIKSLEVSLEEREREKITHQEELTELRRQVDDLQFQLEEQGIISGDTLETATESNEQKLINVTKELERERESGARLRAELETLQHSRESGVGGVSEDGELLRGQLAEAQAQLQEKNREVDTHLQTITQLRTHVSSAETVGNEATSKLAEMTSSLIGRTEELEKVLSQLKDSETTITDYQQRLKTAEERCELVEAQKGELEGQIHQLSQMSGDSSQQLSYLSEQLREKERQVEDLKSGLVSLMDKDQHKSADLESVQEQLKTAKQHSKQVERELSAAETTAGELQLELTSKSKELEEALDFCTQHEALLEERNSELNGLETQIRSLTKEREIWGNERSRLQSEQERLTGERDRAIAECDRLMAHTQTSSDEQNELSRQRRELLAERDSLLAQQQVLQTEYDKMLGEKEELQRQLMDIHQQRQDALGTSQEMSMKFDSTQQELSQALAEVQELKLQLSSSKDDLEHEKLRLQEELELSRANLTDHQQRLDNATHERDSALTQAQDMADKLDVIQIERDQLQQELESAQNQVDEFQFQFEELNSRHQTLENETNAESSAIQQQLENVEAMLAERERELAEEREMVNTLTQDLIASQSKHDHAMLEEEKQLLEERVQELTEQLESSQQSGAPLTLTTQVSVESNNRLEEAQSQLLGSQVEIEALKLTITDKEKENDFLNSVISDLQRKLEMAEAMAGLHGPLEETTASSDYDDDLLQGGLPPPRLFCDICDVFDQHDTDDCPMQAASDSPPPSMFHGKRAPGGSDRPYCEICEVFDHWTDDCQYEATY